MNKRKQNRFSAVQRGLSAMFALLLALCLLPGAQAAGLTGSYASPASTSVNYYSYNGSSLSSLGLLNSSVAYLVTGSATISGVEYYIVTVNGLSCYVKASNLQLASFASTSVETAPATTTTTGAAATTGSASNAAGNAIGTLIITPAGTTNMRSAAHMLSGNIVATLRQNATLPFYATVVPPSGNHVWYYCYDSVSGKFGYVVDDCVRVISMESGATIAQIPDKAALAGAPTADPTLANAQAIGYVRITPKGKTNIRKTAKTDVKNVAAQAEQGEVLPYYAVSVVDGNSWYYVYYAPTSVFGYVQGSCAEITNGSAPASAAATVNPQVISGTQQGTLQFTVGGVNLRKAPNTEAKVLGQFDKGETVAYYGVTSSGGHLWYQVTKNGNSGYVMGDFCLVISGNNQLGGTTQTGQTGAVTAYIMTTSDKVYVRKKTSTGAGVYGQVDQAGTVLPVVGTPIFENGVTWYPVTFNGNTGYIHGGYAALLTADQVAAYQSGQSVPVVQPTVTTAPKAVNYIQVTQDKVWIRKSPSTNAATKGQALLGAVFHFTGMTTGGGVQWYKIDYANETCYIMAKYCRVMTDVEYAAYQGTVTPVNNGSAQAVVGDQSNKAVTTKEKVIVRAEGRSGGKQIALLYRANQLCTLLGPTAVANNYTWYNVTVNGLTGWIRGDLLRILTTAEAASYEAQNNNQSYTGNGSSVNGVVLYKPELIDWNNGGIQQIFAKGMTAIVTDVKTGISFEVKRWSGGDHADVEPLTAADTAAMCRIYGVSKAQDINDKNLYQRHPVLVTLNGHSYAASMYGVPHNYPDGDTIPNNNFNGQFCIHFVNSRIHKTNKVDKDHQAAIMYAYENAAKLLGIQ